ncbi:class I SAM-dependent methyltransferase [Desulfospira joergensenii]|uniref:class I SAM-dependent methyltransferase n=1 Tax=Desulfospira joergensenii TaxID=53329 RepID=UPI0003B75F23|nr:class I SAM-dependent methyltransferase [Desulfospira joergensenii]
MITVDFNRIRIHPHDRILDIGCGEGRHMVRACREKSVLGFGADYLFDNLVQTRNKLRFHQALDDLSCAAWNLSSMDVTRLPFKKNSFDLVICSEVLEHIPDHELAASELIRIVKPGKTLAVSVPRFFPEKICWLLSEEYTQADMGHVRIYRKKEILDMFCSRGMKFLRSHFAHSIHTPYWWLKCMAGPNRTDVALVNLYHRLLVWDMMKKPKTTTLLDRLFNPLLGKSLVLYFTKL